MLAAELTIKLDLDYGQVDFALLERVVHEACQAAHLPVVDVEMDGLRQVDSPVATTALAPPGMVTPTLPPGAQRLP